LIVGREHGENKYLEGYRKQFTHIRTLSHPGPLTLIDGKPEQDDITLAAQISARFSKGRAAETVDVEVNYPDGRSDKLSVVPIAVEAFPDSWYLK